MAGHRLLAWDTDNNRQKAVADGTANQVLITDGSGALTWSSTYAGDITGVTAGTGLSGGGTSGSVTLNVDAAQTQITSLGTLTALTVDDVNLNGKVMTMTGSTGDTAVFTVGTNGTLSIVTVDTAAAAANIQITADGTVDIDSAGILTLDSGAAINLEPAAGSAVLIDGTISIDAGVVTGATSITSTAFVGTLDGVVGGNTPAAGTFTTCDATGDFTIGSTVITDDSIVMTPSASDTVTFAAATNGALTITTVDAAAAAANLLFTVDGTAEIASAGVITLDSGAAINLEPAAGSAVLIDGTVSIDAGVVTGVTSLTSTNLDGIIGASTARAGTFTTLACTAGAFSLASLDIDGGTDINAALVDADLIIVDDGAGGTNRKCPMSRVKTYIDAVTASGNNTYSGTSTFTGTVTVGVDGTGKDVKFFGDTSGSYMLWDQSDDALEFTDSSPIKIGDGGDMELYHNGTNSFITNKTGSLLIGTTVSGIAIGIGNTTSETTVNDNLTVTGDLTVNGTTTTINSTTLTVDDLNVVLASGAADSSAANNAGITVDGASATLLYVHSGTKWAMNKPLDVTGTITSSGVITATGFTIGSAAILEAELEILDGASVTTAELNIMDGDTSATGTTLVAADRVVVNDNGTMVQVAMSDFETFMESNLDTLSSVTSLGTLTTLTVDDVNINGKVMTMTGSTDDTAVFTVGTNGTLSIVTVDTAAAAANIQITADGTVDIDSAGLMTLDSGGNIALEPAAGSHIKLDDVIQVDSGVITGATSITSTAFVGTLSTAAQTNVTSLGTLSSLTVTGAMVGNGAWTIGDASGDAVTVNGTASFTANPSINPSSGDSTLTLKEGGSAKWMMGYDDSNEENDGVFIICAGGAFASDNDALIIQPDSLACSLVQLTVGDGSNTAKIAAKQGESSYTDLQIAGGEGVSLGFMARNATDGIDVAVGHIVYGLTEEASGADRDGITLATAATAAGARWLGVAMEASDASDGVGEADFLCAISGVVKVKKTSAQNETWNVGDPIYLADLTAGAGAGLGTKTAPSGSGDFVSLIGICVEDEDSASATPRRVLLMHQPVIEVG